MAGEKNVVIVPGILGSPLVYADGPSAGQLYWCVPATVQARGAGVLSLAQDGRSPGPFAGGVSLRVFPELQSWQGLTPLVNRLESEGWDPRVWNYDWRLDIVSTGAALAQHLLDQYAGVDFYLIGYSMGGLVARLAYAAWLAAPHTSAWKRTLFVGVPQYGSPRAAQALANPFAGLPPASPSLATIANPIAFGTWLKSVYKGQTQLPAVVASWPALYQLLPSVSAPYPGPNGDNALLLAPATYASVNPSVNAAGMAHAAAARTALDAALSAPEPPQRTADALGVTTLGIYNRGGSPGVALSYSLDPGDGVVPLVRAEGPGFPPVLTVSPVDHRSLIQDPNFLSAVSDLLGDDTVAVQDLQAKGQLSAPLTTLEFFRQAPLPGIPGIGTQVRGDPPG